MLTLTRDVGYSQFEEFVIRPQVKKTPLTVVVDTISGLYDLCLKFVGQRERWDYPPANDHGKGWNAVKRQFLDGMARLTDWTNEIGATLILIDHSKQEILETTTERIEKVTLAMPGQARGIILPVPDHIWFLGYAEKKSKDALRNTVSERALFISGDNTVEAGTRDGSIKVKRIMPLSETNPYKQILNKLYGKIDES